METIKPVPTPQGVLPKNLNYIVIAAIVAVVGVATLFSGKKTKQVPDTPTTSGPNQSQLATFREMLERRSREEEKVQRKLVEAEQMQIAGPQTFSAPPPDPAKEQMRAREASAPFASSRVFQAEPIESSTGLSSQVMMSVQKRPGSTESASAIQSAYKASGQLLPEKVGEFYRIYEGTMIVTKLSNRLDGSFTGPVVTVVSRDAFSKDGTALLVPKGTVFFGEATRVQAQNQSRIAVSFNRLLMPNGYSIELDRAPALNRVGETGLKDKVNNHRLRTFGIAGAIGLLGGFALNRNGPYLGGVANTTGSSATQAMSHYLNALPTITIREGHEVLVYIPDDLLVPKYKPLVGRE